MPSLRRLGADEWDRYRDLRLRALADSPEAFGSTLDAEGQHSDEHWAARLSSAATSQWNLPLVAEHGDELVGLVWGRIDASIPDTAHVFQMWVAPGSRGVGIGTMLLERVVHWARESKAQRVLLNVTCGDTSAWRLYSRAGFKPVGAPEPLRPGSGVLAQPMCLDLT